MGVFNAEHHPVRKKSINDLNDLETVYFLADICLPSVNNVLLLRLSGSDADLVHLHVGAVRVSGPPGGNHLQHAGRRPAVGLFPFEFQHQQVADVLLGHQQE